MEKSVLILAKENEELRKVLQEASERIEKYEGILDQALQRPRSLGIVAAGPENGLYRVTSEAGQSHFLVVHPKLGDVDYKIEHGSKVLMTPEFITELLPEPLEVKPEPVKFDFIDWSEIGGMKSQINHIREAIESPLDNGDIYKEFGLEIMKGCVLYGPPGTGKTLIAKAIASKFLKSIKTPLPESFIYVKGAELLSSYVGQTEASIRNIFERARHHFEMTGVNSVIFIDEADALLPRRGSRRSSDVDLTIVPTFLAEMDGFQKNNPFIILATNMVDSIDPAVIREGRIDLKIYIGRPSIEDCVEIFGIHLKKTLIAEELEDLSATAANILFYQEDIDTKVSGAMIATIVKKAANMAVHRYIKDKNSPKGVTREDIEHVINQTNYEPVESGSGSLL